MNLIAGVSLVAAFIGGMIALFAPCCITFLLPSYLGNIFKNKDRAVWMTLIFGLGIATVLVPTALGIRAIGQLFLNFHTQTYWVGGVFMIFLGLLNLTGNKISLPMIHLTIDLNKRHDPWSIYLLGVFSGITSSCCTPVLVGILTLTFLSPTFFWAAMAGFAYVAGMVMPLVLMALLLEKVNFGNLAVVRRYSDQAAGVIFLGIGLFFLWLAATGRVVMGTPIDMTIIYRWLNLK